MTIQIRLKVSDRHSIALIVWLRIWKILMHIVPMKKNSSYLLGNSWLSFSSTFVRRNFPEVISGVYLPLWVMTVSVGILGSRIWACLHLMNPRVLTQKGSRELKMQVKERKTPDTESLYWSTTWEVGPSITGSNNRSFSVFPPTLKIAFLGVGVGTNFPWGRVRNL